MGINFTASAVRLIINHLGEIVNVIFSKGNAADNNKKLLREITEDFIGLLIGDKGDRRSDISLLSEKSY